MSPCENVMADDMCGQSTIVAAMANKPLGRQKRCFLDGRDLSISVRVSAANIQLTRRGKNHLMKRFILIIIASLIAFPLFGQEKSPQLKDQKDKVSYSIGMNIGFNLSRQKVDVNPDILAAGIKDSLAGKPQLTPDQVKEVMAQFEKDMEAKQKQAGEKNKTEGVKFLDDNKKKSDVKTTASG